MCFLGRVFPAALTQATSGNLPIPGFLVCPSVQQQQSRVAADAGVLKTRTQVGRTRTTPSGNLGGQLVPKNEAQRRPSPKAYSPTTLNIFSAIVAVSVIRFLRFALKFVLPLYAFSKGAKSFYPRSQNHVQSQRKIQITMTEWD